MKKYLAGVVILQILLALESQGQKYRDTLYELNIGDMFPEMTLSNVINHTEPTLEVGGSSGKLLIIEFWATWCTPCVANMPRLDSLQKEFEKEIEILPVTYQSPTDVENLIKKNKRFKNISIPIVTNDNVLRLLFPHKSLPHYVWINGKGKILAITGEGELTRMNIKRMITDESVSLKVKRDIIKDFKREKPLLLQDLGLVAEQIQFQSLLTRYHEGMSVRFDAVRNEEKKVTKVSMLNYSIKNLFSKAWTDETKGQYWERTMVLVEANDSNSIYFKEKDPVKYKEWLKENSFCYEITIPGDMQADIFSYIREDMIRFFPQYTVVVEKRNVRCLVLERTTVIDKLRSSGGKLEHHFDPYGGKMKNCRLGLLIRQLNYFLQLTNLPVVDATNYEYPVDMNLEAAMSDVSSLRKALQRYDLDLVEKDYEIEMLIIKNRK